MTSSSSNTTLPDRHTFREIGAALLILLGVLAVGSAFTLLVLTCAGLLPYDDHLQGVGALLILCVILPQKYPETWWRQQFYIVLRMLLFTYGLMVWIWPGFASFLFVVLQWTVALDLFIWFIGKIRAWRLRKTQQRLFAVASQALSEPEPEPEQEATLTLGNTTYHGVPCDCREEHGPDCFVYRGEGFPEEGKHLTFTQIFRQRRPPVSTSGTPASQPDGGEEEEGEPSDDSEGD